MPLIALDGQTKERIKAFEFENSLFLREKHPHTICPDCLNLVHPRGGNHSQKRTHFAHNKGECPSPIDRHPYEPIHEQSVLALALYLDDKYLKANNLKDYSIEVEYRMPQIGKHGRIADLVILNPEKKVVEVHEVQYSPISVELLKARLDNYASFGIDCIWHFGGKCAQNPEYKEWSLDRLGYFSTPFKITEITAPSDYA